MQPTSIVYLTHTWNPLAMRCTRISPACDNCWHLAMANRLAANPTVSPEARAAYAGETGPLLIKSRLDEPLKRRKPAVIGTQFMGDLFLESVSYADVGSVWTSMQIAHATRGHTFLVLTKRPARMLEFVSDFSQWESPDGRTGLDICPGIWLGVTVENQAAADERRADFEATPAAVKFVSYEPALEVVDWSGWEFVDQIISGGETGPAARPSHPDWHRAARDFCIEHDKSYFFKSWGEFVTIDRAIDHFKHNPYMNSDKHVQIDSYSMPFVKVGNKHAGDKLDGVRWQEMPGETKCPSR